MSLVELDNLVKIGKLKREPASPRKLHGLRESALARLEDAGRLEREIDLLREYHTRLVANVVTDKLDVREAASRLPDEVGDGSQINEGKGPVEDEDAAVEDLNGVPDEAEQ